MAGGLQVMKRYTSCRRFRFHFFLCARHHRPLKITTTHTTSWLILWIFIRNNGPPRKWLSTGKDCALQGTRGDALTSCWLRQLVKGMLLGRDRGQSWTSYNVQDSRPRQRIMQSQMSTASRWRNLALKHWFSTHWWFQAVAEWALDLCNLQRPNR